MLKQTVAGGHAGSKSYQGNEATPRASGLLMSAFDAQVNLNQKTEECRQRLDKVLGRLRGIVSEAEQGEQDKPSMTCGMLHDLRNAQVDASSLLDDIDRRLSELEGLL